jgi:tetratricopeptide (TPR) repeat protein
VKRILEGLIIGIIASLIAGLILAPHLIPIFWKTYKTELYIAVLLITILALLYFIWERAVRIKKGMAEAFDVFKPVKKLTPDDFHIAEYNEFYVERESDKHIETLLGKRKYVFITGIPMLGKTRMAYEATKKLKGFYLLRPKYERIEIQKLKLPLFKKKIVLFLDDLNKYVEKFDLDDLIRKLKKESKDFVVIATCRSGKEFDQVFAKKEMETLLTQCQKREPRKLKQEEERKLATAVDKRLERIASDGTPGSITIDLRYMKERYENLGEEKSILKSLKLLREGNIFLWKEDMVKEVSNGIFDLGTERTEWDGYLKSLLRNGFINKFSERIFISHDVYLDDKFLDDYSVNCWDLKSLKWILFSKLKDAENLRYLGNGYYYKENLSEAEDCYRKSIEINPESAEAHNNLGNLFADLRRNEEAEKELREALLINPDFAMAHFNLSLLLSALERYKEAEEECRAALRIKPDYDKTRYHLKKMKEEHEEASQIERDFAQVVESNGHYNEAEEEYREALRINPDDAEAHYNLGVLLYDLKRYDEAEKEYREALWINPDYAEAHGNLGFLFVTLNRNQEAKKEFEIVRDLFRKQGREEDAKKVEGFLKGL